MITFPYVVELSDGDTTFYSLAELKDSIATMEHRQSTNPMDFGKDDESDLAELQGLEMQCGIEGHIDCRYCECKEFEDDNDDELCPDCLNPIDDCECEDEIDEYEDWLKDGINEERYL